MDSEARLMRALGAAAAPKRDPAFTLAVMRRAEAERFRAETARTVLRAAALAAAAAIVAVPGFRWAAANADALQQGLLASLAIATLVYGMRMLTARAVAAR